MSNNNVPEENPGGNQAATEQAADNQDIASDEHLQTQLADAEAKAKENWDQLLRVKAEHYLASVRSPKRARSLVGTGIARFPEKLRNLRHLRTHARACRAVFLQWARLSLDEASVPAPRGLDTIYSFISIRPICQLGRAWSNLHQMWE